MKKQAKRKQAKPEQNTVRPVVKPVYGTCGHIARSEQHTCGAYFCVQMFAY